MIISACVLITAFADTPCAGAQLSAPLLTSPFMGMVYLNAPRVGQWHGDAPRNLAGNLLRGNPPAPVARWGRRMRRPRVPHSRTPA